MYSTVHSTSETMMPIGTSRWGLLGLLGVGRDRVEADVGEEDDRRAGEHADRLAGRARLPEQRVAEEADRRSAERRERRPVGRVDVERADDDHEQHDRQLDDHHRRR